MSANTVENRFSRQQRLAEIGAAGQDALANSTVMIVGCGALGCMSAEFLARAGVGRLVLVDRDLVEWSNLQRQHLFDEADAMAGEAKVAAACARLKAINQQVDVVALSTDLHAGNAESLLKSLPAPCDVIIDGLDNFNSRFVLNDLAVKYQVPLIYGAAVATFGSVYVVLPKQRDPSSLCLQCLFPDELHPGMSPGCSAAGVLGPLIAQVAAKQVTEALKILTGRLQDVDRQLGLFDPWYNLYQPVTLSAPLQSCSCCEAHQFDFLGQKTASGSQWLCGHETIQIRPPQPIHDLDFHRLAQQLPADSYSLSCFMLRYKTSVAGREVECTFFRDGRALVRGLDDLAVASRLYSELLEL